MLPRNSCGTVLCLILLTYFRQIACCLDCYSCNPLSNSCAENFDSKTAKKITCLEDVENACIKLEILGTVTRTCGVYDTCVQSEFCHACTKHLCNVSSNISPLFTSNIFTVLSIIKYFT